MSRREALAQVAVATGAMINTSRTNIIQVRPVPEPADIINNIIGKDRVYQSAAVDIEFPFTGIELTEHNFSVGSGSRELFKDIFIGEKTVRFSEPAANLTIENGIIISPGVNHAVISSSGVMPCVLTGKPYIDSQSSVIIKTESEYMIEGTQERTEKIGNCYLVNKNNSAEVAQRLYKYYLRQNLFDGDFLVDINLNPEKIGDIVNIATGFDDNSFISGQIEKLTLRLGSRNIKARGIIRGN